MTVFKHAQWIFAATPQVQQDSYYDYEKRFLLPCRQPVTIAISAHSRYALYINDCFVDCGPLPDTENRQLYDTLDLTPYVHEGENVLRITQYVIGRDFSTCALQKAGVIFAVWSGNSELCVSDTDCVSGPNRKYLPNGEMITSQMGFNFEYDANGPETELAPSVLAGKEKCLFPRPTKRLKIEPAQLGVLRAQGVFLEKDPGLPKSKRMQTAYLSAMTKKQLGREQDGYRVTVPEDCRADGVYLIYDLGQETAGYLQFELEVSEKTQVLIGYGEHLEDLRVRSSCGYRNFCFRYLAKPGVNRFFHPFRRIGLRYLQLHIYTKSAKVKEVSVRPTVYPMDRKPAPVRDLLHKRIWDVASRTLELCMQDHFCDCIWREQTLYPYDGRMAMLCSYYGFDAPEYARESLRICAETLRPDGLLEICAPGRDSVNIPHYSAVYLRAVEEYTQFTGDLSLSEEIFPVLQILADGFVARITEKGLIPMYQGNAYWHFYEWKPGMDGKNAEQVRNQTTRNEYELPMNALIADGLLCFARLCHRLKPQLEAGYRAAGQTIREAAHRVFFKNGGYLTRLTEDSPRHELTQGLMLYLDAVPASHREQVEALIRSKQLIRTSLGLAVFAYEGLLKNPENRDFVRKDVEERWGKMLQTGCDTFWETEEGSAAFGGAGALCQSWSAIPLYLFGHYKLGE